MANNTNVPLSELLKSRNSSEDEPKKKSREDWRKAKELEEARKAGTAPAAVDEHGKDINPHIPQYISSAPWYYGSSGPTLKHQRPQPEKQQEFSKLDEWYKRGVDTTNVAKKYRPGSCENCGAMTHKKKDCMERPRKIGAAYTGVQFGPDEKLQPNLNLDFDGKRDRWAGYDPSMHQAIVEEYAQIEDAKRRLRAERLENDNEEKDDVEGADDEDKYVDDLDMPGTKVDSKQRITVRNLRIREDTAKYLRNLDPDSAYYDPKTRSMRDNPNPKADDNDTDYAGENFVRFSGDTTKHAHAQQFAWDAYEKGVDVHILAEPTKLEMLQRVYDSKKEEYKSNVQDSVVEKYGGVEHLQAPPKALLLAQTEHYVEYSRYGKVIKGEEKPIIRSRYEEDNFPGNHTSVFGSYWQAGQWGYKCCHSFIKNSYCVGESGKDVDTATQPVESSESGGAAQLHSTTTSAVLPPAGTSSLHEDSDSGSSSDSIPETDGIDKELAAKIKKKLKKKKLKKKLKKQLKRERREEKKNKKTDLSYDEQLKMAIDKEEKEKRKSHLLVDDRKRSYNSMIDVKAPTDAEMEAYLMKRTREEDPMASKTIPGSKTITEIYDLKQCLDKDLKTIFGEVSACLQH